MSVNILPLFRISKGIRPEYDKISIKNLPLVCNAKEVIYNTNLLNDVDLAQGVRDSAKISLPMLRFQFYNPLGDSQPNAEGKTIDNDGKKIPNSYIEGVSVPNFILAIDIDKKDSNSNLSLDDYISISNTYANHICYANITGSGGFHFAIKFTVPKDNELLFLDTYNRAHAAFCKQIHELFNIKVDTNAKSINQLLFVYHHPLSFTNPHAAPLQIDIDVTSTKPIIPLNYANVPKVAMDSYLFLDDIIAAVDYCEIFSGSLNNKISYEEHHMLASAMFIILGEGGASLFERLCCAIKSNLNTKRTFVKQYEYSSAWAAGKFDGITACGLFVKIIKKVAPNYQIIKNNSTYKFFLENKYIGESLEICNHLREIIDSNDEVFIEAPPGTGKTHYISNLIKDTHGKENYISVITVPTQGQVKQVAEDYGIGFWISGMDESCITESFNNGAIVLCVAGLANILNNPVYENIKQFKYLIKDEAHEDSLTSAENYRLKINTVLFDNRHRFSKVIYISGTPHELYLRLNPQIKRVTIIPKYIKKCVLHERGYSNAKDIVALNDDSLHDIHCPDGKLVTILCVSKTQQKEIKELLVLNGFAKEHEVAIVSSNTKLEHDNDEVSKKTFDSIVKTSLVPDGIKYLLTTTLLYAGYNINNTNLHAVHVLDSKEIYNSIVIRQFVARFRHADILNTYLWLSNVRGDNKYGYTKEGCLRTVAGKIIIEDILLGRVKERKYGAKQDGITKSNFHAYACNHADNQYYRHASKTDIVKELLSYPEFTLAAPLENVMDMDSEIMLTDLRFIKDDEFTAKAFLASKMLKGSAEFFSALSYCGVHIPKEFYFTKLVRTHPTVASLIDSVRESNLLTIVDINKTIKRIVDYQQNYQLPLNIIKCFLFIDAQPKQQFTVHTILNYKIPLLWRHYDKETFLNNTKDDLLLSTQTFYDAVIKLPLGKDLTLVDIKKILGNADINDTELALAIKSLFYYKQDKSGNAVQKRIEGKVMRIYNFERYLTYADLDDFMRTFIPEELKNTLIFNIKEFNMIATEISILIEPKVTKEPVAAAATEIISNEAVATVPTGWYKNVNYNLSGFSLSSLDYKHVPIEYTSDYCPF